MRGPGRVDVKVSGLLERKLLFVVGKGGVGKTTVSGALGLEACRREQKVLIIELESENRLLPLFGRDEAASPEPVEVSPGLFRMGVSGRAALEEYLSMVIPIRRVLRAVFDNRIYQYFVAAAPGLRELMAIGKIWFEVDRGHWDLIIVDCPATGHSLQYLRMPKAAVDTFTAGLVHREARRVWDLLTDGKRTGIVLVTLPEEMPVNEALEMCAQLDRDLGLPRGALVLNRIQEVDLSREDLARISLPEGSGAEERALVDAVRERAAQAVAWDEVHRRHGARLVESCDWPVIRLPFLAREEFAGLDVETLAGLLGDSMPTEALP